MVVAGDVQKGKRVRPVEPGERGGRAPGKDAGAVVEEAPCGVPCSSVVPQLAVVQTIVSVGGGSRGPVPLNAMGSGAWARHGAPGVQGERKHGPGDPDLRDRYSRLPDRCLPARRSQTV